MADWLDMSKYQSRRILPLVGNWDPNNWDPSAIDWDKVVAEAEVVIIRIGDGLNLDPCFTRYREALVTRRAVWGIYHLHRPSVALGRQETFVLTHQPTKPPAGVWGDFEFNEGYTGEGYYSNANHYLLGLDRMFGGDTGMYSGAWFLDPILTRAQQQRWSARKGWWSGYPNMTIPSGWRDSARPYVLHQYTDRKVWAGLPKPADASRRNPAVPLQTLVAMQAPPVLPPPPPSDELTGEEQAVLRGVAASLRTDADRLTGL